MNADSPESSQNEPDTLRALLVLASRLDDRLRSVNVSDAQAVAAAKAEVLDHWQTEFPVAAESYASFVTRNPHVSLEKIAGELTDREKRILADKIDGKTYAEIAARIGLTVAGVNKCMTKLNEKLKIQARVHPDEAKYHAVPEAAEPHEQFWHRLTSYQLCVAHLHFAGASHRAIAETLGFELRNVYGLLCDARKKLEITFDPSPPEHYASPPQGANITAEQWSTLMPSEKIVAKEALEHPAKPDKVLAAESGLSVKSIATLRRNARKKLGIALEKITVLPEPSNKAFSKAHQYPKPPKGYEVLKDIWCDLTPRQRCVLSLALQNISQEDIAAELDMELSQVQNHKSAAYAIASPLLYPIPTGVEPEAWGTLGRQEKKVVALRLEHPEWTAKQIAASFKSTPYETTEGAVRQALNAARGKLDVPLTRGAQAKYNAPPTDAITQEAWNALQPRHRAVAWESLHDPGIGPKDVVALLGIVKRSEQAAIKYVKEIRREAGLILGVEIRKRANED